MIRTVQLACLAIGVTACKRPPEAPAELEQLCTFLYERVYDGEDEDLEAGLINLEAWMADHLDATLEGYTIENLSQDAVDSLDGKKRGLDGLVGAAVGTTSPYDVVTINEVLVTGDPFVVYGDTYSEYDRTYLTDVNCFVEQTCSRLDIEIHSIANFALGLEVEADTHNQYRWVALEDGWAHVYRTWLVHPAEVNFNWLDVPQQFFLSAMMPWKDGGSLRLQATWVVAEFANAPVPEATALNLVISTMQSSDESIDGYLDTH